MSHFLNSVAPPFPHHDAFSRSPPPRFVAGRTRLLASSNRHMLELPRPWSVGEVRRVRDPQHQGAWHLDGPSLWACQAPKSGRGGWGAERDQTDRS